MPSTCSSAPKDKYASSTRLIAACATSSPISSGRSPPTSCESDNFPSENAPAPEKPVVMRHGSHPTQWPTFALGQLRRSMGRPFSTSAMVVEGASFRSDNAVKIPAGPAPTITTSTVKFEVFELLEIFETAETKAPTASPLMPETQTHSIVAHGFKRHPAKTRAQRFLTSCSERRMPSVASFPAPLRKRSKRPSKSARLATLEACPYRSWQNNAPKGREIA